MKAPSALPGTYSVLFLIRKSGHGLKSCQVEWLSPAFGELAFTLATKPDYFMGAVSCLSPSHFTRVFCRLIGIPPVEFLSALRFQKVRRLLVTTSLSVTEICFAVGYSSIGSFTSRFTHLVGLSPRWDCPCCEGNREQLFKKARKRVRLEKFFLLH